MRDELLFVVAPRLAAFCCLTILGVLLFAGRAPALPVVEDRESSDPLLTHWRYPIALVLFGHVLAVAFPGTVMLWDRDPFRMLLLESAGLIAAGAALVALVLAFVRHLGRNRRPVDVIAATLIILQVVSGLTVAVRYRWASSWAEVTLVPYLRSLLGHSPSIVLVARMPFVVQLHVFCAFVLLAIVPMSRIVSPLMVPIQGLSAGVAALLRSPRAPWRAIAWIPVDGVSADVQNDNQQH
jgi:nitrate reductase gamma subunit